MQPLHLKRLKDRTAENIPGATGKPSVTILNETKDGLLLRCEVRGAFPKPEVEWKDSDGNIVPAEEPRVSERGGRYDIILQTTVTKAGHFRCVATQKEINHQIYAEIYVPIRGAPPKLSVTSLKNGVLLQCEVQGASSKPKLHWQDGAGKLLHAKESEVSERGGRYKITLETTVNKTDNYRCVAMQTETSRQIYADIYVNISGSSTRLVVTAVLGPLVVVVLGIIVLQ
ncbi:hemicentin-1-like [Thunnus albacares]|uniref:hemicentin-1-like n=1 Tax=Thunnus albacares TaxID=8236 RepID=UPI001CF60E22|nr:hemicentin-1-like [Thunnus albacares]